MTTDRNRKTVVLGDEFDYKLRNKLNQALISLGCDYKSTEWGVGGSQELETLEVEIKGQLLTIESETYIGLSISGDELLIQRIEQLIKS